jgi:hypothetical protein
MVSTGNGITLLPSIAVDVENRRGQLAVKPLAQRSYGPAYDLPRIAKGDPTPRSATGAREDDGDGIPTVDEARATFP